MTPRRYFAEQIFGTLIEGGRTDVPVYNDKHLSYNWADAKWMYDKSRELGFPLTGGSSIPVYYREPSIEVRILPFSSNK